ncbi:MULTISPECIES: glucose PTS transporter subunit IIA [unclassified Enterococcus]|uniref:glucose PTS transporter subunit IIA n=1 Tax=unclassified Enterococcus TaxID=2608891 RepID=UPI003F1EB7DF
MKYEATVNGIVENIGGLSNLTSAGHCATRLRFKLNDMTKLNEAELKKTKAVMGVRVMEGNEIQIIIGTDVSNVYEEFMDITGYKGTGSGATATKGKLTLKGFGSMVVEYVSGTVAPVIPIYLGCGMLLAFLTICTNFLGLDPDSGAVVILNAAAGAGFYFMPIVLGWSAAAKLKADPALGALLGMTLLAADINNVGGLDFLGLPVTQVQYNGSFLPMLLGTAFLAMVYRFFKNKIPQAGRYFLLPLVTLVIAIPVTLVILGPIGYIAGTKLMWLLNLIAAHFKLGALAIWGFLTPLSIITGMDKAVYFINMEHLNSVGFDNIFLPGGLAGNSAIGGAALAVWYLSRNTDTKSIGASSGITAIIGITEPALYGICLNFRTPLLGAMTGAAIGSVFAGIVDLKQYVYAGPGLVTSPVYISPDGSMTNFIFCLITIAFSAIAGFGMTYLFSLKNKRQYDGEPETAGVAVEASETSVDEAIVVTETVKEIDLFQLCDGQVIPMEDVSDPVFSQKMMGDGYAVKPSDSTMYSPVFGVISTIFETQHAIGIRTENGLDVLVHMGIDTVSLKGEPFEILVEVGDKVTENTPIAKVDLEKIIAAGKSDEMIVVVTNMIDVKEFEYDGGSTGHRGDLVATVELN